MPVIKLQLPDGSQGAEIKKALQQRVPEAKVFQGSSRQYETDWDPNTRELHIDYHDEKTISEVLDDHFAPSGHKWQQFRK